MTINYSLIYAQYNSNNDHDILNLIQQALDNRIESLLTPPQESATKAEADMEQQLQRTLTALERGLDFMWRHRKEVNLDGVIGTRLVAGRLM